MKIIRLENTGFGASSLLEDEVDKVIEFDSESGVLKVHVLTYPQRIPFGGTQEANALVRGFLGQDLNDGTVRVIHDTPVPNAYSAPFKIYLDITLACSLQCSFCSSDAGRGVKTSLPADVVERISTEIRDLGVMYVKIGGGDPLLHPDFETIVTLLRSVGCFLTILFAGER